MSRSKITLISAMDVNRLIGSNNQLPWHLPEDLQHFREKTLNKPIIMGRKTYESIGRPLPQRQNIIVSNDPLFIPAPTSNCHVVSSIEDALLLFPDYDEIFIIGGSSIYEQTISIASHLCLTIINSQFEGDKYFPDWNSESHSWRLVDKTDYISRTGLEYSICNWERIF